MIRSWLAKKIKKVAQIVEGPPSNLAVIGMMKAGGGRLTVEEARLLVQIEGMRGRHRMTPRDIAAEIGHRRQELVLSKGAPPEAKEEPLTGDQLRELIAEQGRVFNEALSQGRFVSAKKAMNQSILLLAQLEQRGAS